MSRRQSVDRPGILSPPGPFLTPSPSPSIPASPRLQPSPSISPFSHDVLIVTNNTITNTTQEQERKAATPSRRPSIHQLNSGSPNAGTIVFQPSPSQSPAAAATVVGIAGNEFNTTLVGSNNISLNKKTGKRTPQSYVNYGPGTTITSTGTLAATNVASSPKGSSKKASSLHQTSMTNPAAGSPLMSESPIASPSGQLKPPTPQPQVLQQLPVVNAGNHLLQFIQGPQLITTQPTVTTPQRSQTVGSGSSIQNQNAQSASTTSGTTKNSRGHQQILPKPQQPTISAEKMSNKNIVAQQQTGQVTQTTQATNVVTTGGNQQGQQQIILPTGGNLNTQPLLLNQMPVIVQQNTPQGVQLILRPPTPQLATPSLVIHNSRPQLQQPQPQQLLRILNTNGTMQLTTAPTFIVSSQANLIQQNLQTIKANAQSSPITQLSGLHTAPRSQLAAAFNSHIIGQSVAQLQNLQLNGNLAQIQMPNGLNGPIISQLPAQFQHLPGFNHLNLNQINSTNLQQIAAAAAAAGAAFQSPPPPQVSELQLPSVVSAQNIQFSASSTPIAQPVNLTSQAVGGQPQLISSVTPEPVRHPTPTLQTVLPHPATTTVLVQPDNVMPSGIVTGTMATATTKTKTGIEMGNSETPTSTKPPKKARTRKKKAQTTVPTTQTTITTTTSASAGPVTVASTAKGRKDNSKQQQQQQQQQQHQQLPPVTSTGKLDLADVMKLCGIMEDDDYMDTETDFMTTVQHEEPKQIVSQQLEQVGNLPTSVSSTGDIMITIPNQSSDIPFTFTIPTSQCDSGSMKSLVSVNTSLDSNAATAPNAGTTDLKLTSNVDPQNIVIKIDQIDSVPPYTITIPRDEIQQTMQLVQQTHQQQQQQPNSMILPQPLPPRSVSVSIGGTNNLISSTSSSTPTINNVPTFVNSHMTPTLQSQINEIQNQLIGVTSTTSNIVQPTIHSTPTTVVASSISQPLTTVQPHQPAPTPVTTAAIKPRRKPAAKRNGKKIDTIPTSVGNVPSQIGNIQISQIDATKIANQNMPISNVVENKIQIMPIIDSKTAQAQQNQTQQTIQLQHVPAQQPAAIHQQFMPVQQQQHPIHSEANKNNNELRNLHITAQSLGHGNLTGQQASAAASIFPQLTGNLSLTFEEDGSRLILRHDPNLPQDPQSQIILQAILSGALCNVTIVNEPFDKNKALKNNVTLNSTNSTQSNSQQLLQQPPPQNSLVTKTFTQAPVQNSKNQAINQQPLVQQPHVSPMVSTSPALTSNQLTISNESQKQRSQDTRKAETPMALVNATPTSSIVVNPTSPKLVALPKVDANQQLFTLNTITNQITHINPGQTTAALGPMERLLIVPIGINAQQLADCLSQGQIHFNNIGQAAQATEQQIQSQPQANVVQPQPPQIQQQIVRPQQHQTVQPLHQTQPAKQVANVAPIIDTSKAKAETKPKKTPKPRKPKVCNETTINKSVKPIKKLDLTTKPSANPVQIVQPNTATKDLQVAQQQAQNLLRGSSGSSVVSITTSTANIHPFQTQTTGNKLVGVTAPMQQITQPRNTLNNQCNSSNSNNSILSTNNNVTASTLVGSQQTASSATTAGNHISTPGSNNQPTVSVLPKLPSDMSHQIPPLISVNTATTQPPPPAVPRVQTIQLTPQQQQLLKTVQTQIQQLSARLQNKSLLANLIIPSDFNPNNPVYNKPLPQLNNIQFMNDGEIHAALQRLFIEQQKILASGKLIPTIPAPSPHSFMPPTSSSPAPTSTQPPAPSPTQSPTIQQFPTPNKVSSAAATTHSNNVMQTTHLKNEGQCIPANIVQPNNHNSTANNSNNATPQQRIHIYPMQHQSPMQMSQNLIHQQQQQQQQQQQPHLQMISPTSQLDLQLKPQITQQHSQTQHQPVHQLTPQPSQNQSSRPNLSQVSNKPQQFIQPPMHLQQQSQQQQQQTLLAHHQQQLASSSNYQRTSQCLPQQPTHQQVSVSIDTGQKQIPIETLSSSASMSMSLQQPNQQPPQQHQPHQQSPPQQPQLIVPPSKPITPNSNLNVAAAPKIETPEPIPDTAAKSPAPVASPKPKIPRHFLFERQLKVDQEGCINPDYMTPFQSKEDAVKRLIRYHCMYQQDESFSPDEEEELEKIALNLQEKFRTIAHKYQYLLLQESMRLHPTSELCLLNELLIADEEKDLKSLKDDQLTTNDNIFYQNNNVFPEICYNAASNNKAIKKEFESQPSAGQMSMQSQYHLSPFDQHQQRQQQHSNDLQFGQNQDLSYRQSIKSEVKSEPNESIFDKRDNQSNATDHKMANNRALTSPSLSNLSRDIASTTTQSYSNCNKTNYDHHSIKGEKDRCLFANAAMNVSSQPSYSTKNSEFVKRENDSFDIEAEITPSFIMKKVENNDPAPVSTVPTTTATTAVSAAAASDHDMANNGFSIDYFMNPTTTQSTSYSTSTLAISDQLDDKKKNEEDSKSEQYDEWLCIQKELNLITEKKNEASLTSQQQKLMEKQLSDIFDTPSNKTVENHLSDLFNSSSSGDSTMEASNSGDHKAHHNLSVSANLHLSEFFNPDSLASKSVENRLEAMFGESPVVEKSEQDTVESRLEEIFNGSSSPTSQHYNLMENQNKRQWNNGNDIMQSNAPASVSSTYDKRPYINSYLDETHVTSNHPRWMMEQHQFDFMAEAADNDTSSGGGGRSKRPWNGEMTNSLEHMSNKKMCFTSKVDSDLEHDLLGLGPSSPGDTMTSELMRHTMNQHGMQDSNAQLHQSMSHMHNNVIMQMQQSHHLQQQQQQHSMHDHHHQQQMQSTASLMNQTVSIFETSLSSTAGNQNLSGSSSSASLSSNFDEDINRHVQNAIDSILNLQSSENDSLNFASLEHSMGSFLTDAALDQQQSHHHHHATVGGTIIQTPTNNSHCVLSSSAASVVGKRRQHMNRMDDLADCLISGGGMGTAADGNAMMVNSPSSVMSATGTNSTSAGGSVNSSGLSDFSCVSGIDDAVKSIMTS